MSASNDHRALVEELSTAGFVAAEEEARELVAVAAGDRGVLEALLDRRLAGEPLAWITGRVRFSGTEVRVEAGVYVPRPQSEALALRAVERLPVGGTAIDLCTGAGAIAKTLVANRPSATVVASELDERAVGCARSNGIAVYRGDLFSPLPPALGGRADVIVGVVPYVPSAELPLLQRDTLTFESTLSYDGGPDGVGILQRVIGESPRFLRRGGALLLELGGHQAELLADELMRAGYLETRTLVDEDGDVRGIEATLTARRRRVLSVGRRRGG